jgi:phage shock protein PspC (stress-responsive transcriptional regulator)
MLHKIPSEIIASILAATTAFVGGNALHLPTWAIFIGWAGCYLAGGPNLPTMKKLWAAMPIGSTYALIIIILCNQFGTVWGTGFWGTAGFQAVMILIFNTALMFTGRIKVFNLVPGMFFGFASMFATCYGGFGWDAKNVWIAWIAAIVMNFFGPIYAWVAEWLTTPRNKAKTVHTAETNPTDES